MIKKILVLLLITTCVLAGSPVIWGPNQTSRDLQSNFNLNNIASLLTGTANPSAVAQSAPQGSLYLRTGASGGTLWVKQDAGSSTNWTVLSTASGSWSTTGNGGLVAGTNFLGTSDAVSLVFKTNATEAMRIDSSQNIGFNTIPADLFHFKWSNNGQNMLWEGPGAGTYHQWQWIPSSAGSLLLKNTDNSSFFHMALSGSDGYTGFGVTPDYKLHVSKGSVDVTPTGLSTAVPMVVVQNSSSTVNNWSGLAFENSSSVTIDSLIAGIHENQSASGSQTGRLGFYTANSGVVTETLRLNSNMTVQVRAGNLDLNTHKINNVVDPSAAQDAATKNYVDTQLLQLNPADSVYAASTANIPGTYTNAVSGVCIGDIFTITATGALSLDGTSPAIGARVLLKDQTSAWQDGVWTVTVVGSLGVSPVLTRALDFDSAADMNAGQIIPIVNGTANAGASYYQTATITTCSSSSQTWTKFQSAASSYMLKASNLSDVVSTQTAINNISQLTTKGDLLIYSGTNSTRQAACPDGQNLQYLASATNGVTCVTPPAAGGSGNLNARWALTGAVVPFTDIDGPHYQVGTQSLTTVNLAMLNSGTSGNTSVRINQYRSGLLFNAQTAVVAASSGNPTSVASALTGTLSLVAGDVLTVDITQVANGTPESISVEY